MKRKPNSNVLAAYRMYSRRLEELSTSIRTTVALGAAGKISEDEALERMSLFEEEVDDIHECIAVLEHLSAEG